MAPTDIEKWPSSEDSGTSIQTGNVVETTELTQLGYEQQLQRNRSMYTLLFQSLAIAVR